MAYREYTRPLSRYLANRCESAVGPKCTCRCNGVLHGKAHAEFLKRVNEALEIQGVIIDDDIQDIMKELDET